MYNQSNSNGLKAGGKIFVRDPAKESVIEENVVERPGSVSVVGGNS